jgi:hypothetical protein
MGQEVYYANQVTVAWDPVIATGTVSYEVFIAPFPVPADLDTGPLNLVLETASTEAVVTFPEEGKYIIGIRTKKSIDGDVLYSDINWSHENGIATPNPFILGYYAPPDVPEDFHIVGEHPR